MPNAENPNIKISKSKKKKFSSFRKDEAFQYLGLTDLLPWTIETDSVQPSNFFQEHLSRLNRHFDLESYEESKKLLIDAICDEAINSCDRLKIWKGAQLESDRLAGYPEYRLTFRDWLDMQKQIEEILGREVDLTQKELLKNPYTRSEILKTNQVVYAAEQS